MIELYPYDYPLPVDWDQSLRELLPDVAANRDGFGFARSLFRPLSTLDDAVAQLYAGMVEIGDASELGLTIAGDLVGEPPGGLTTEEYRRIIAGRRVAVYGAVTAPRVLAGWRAVTGSTEVHLYTLEPATVLLTARVTFLPTSTYLVRAGSVVRDLVGAGYSVSASLYRNDTAIYDHPSLGYDVGTYAYDLVIPET